MIKVGTSGFSYDDWKGTFYPVTIKKSDMLMFYSRFFDCLEVNFTYYRLPAPSQFIQMIEKTGGKVEFVIKAHKSLTHDRPDDPGPACRDFLERLRPCGENGVLGAILLQFPYSFKNLTGNREYIMSLRESLSEIPLVIEFRHNSWLSDNTFELLRQLDCGFCCVDEPQLNGLMPKVVELTSKIGYVRFHGRNAEKWWEHDHAWERYHYLYTEAELGEWIDGIRQLEQGADKVYLFANNHYNGNAATNATMLKDMLGIADHSRHQPLTQLSLMDTLETKPMRGRQ